MFGYINVYKNELKVKDYNIFKAYYCGLCKTLGSRHNQFARLGLSYDMTFLALLSDSLNDSDSTPEIDGCIKHFGKHPIYKNNPYIDYASDTSIILSYYKLTDDIKDKKSVKAYLARIVYIRAMKKIGKKYPELSKTIKEKLDELSLIEKFRCSSVDKAADPFALLTQSVFSCADESLSHLGYNIGRLIYLIDAIDDIHEDMANKTYNPFIDSYGADSLKTDEFKTAVHGTINMTLSAISEEYQKLDIRKNKDILDNIIYMGLRFSVENVFRNMEEKNERSL